MSFISTQWAKLNEYLETRIQVLPVPLRQFLDRISARTGFTQTNIASGIIIVFAIFMILSSKAQFVCNVIGFAIPAYLSMTSIESPGSDGDTVWLMYWVVFATFSLIDFFADRILRLFPFYWLAKCIFLVWCYCPLPPRQNGAVKIHRKILRPFFVARRQGIDKTLQNTLGVKLSSEKLLNAAAGLASGSSEATSPTSQLTLSLSRPTISQSSPPPSSPQTPSLPQLISLPLQSNIEAPVSFSLKAPPSPLQPSAPQPAAVAPSAPLTVSPTPPPSSPVPPSLAQSSASPPSLPAPSQPTVEAPLLSEHNPPHTSLQALPLQLSSPQSSAPAPSAPQAVSTPPIAPPTPPQSSAPSLSPPQLTRAALQPNVEALVSPPPDASKTNKN